MKGLAGCWVNLVTLRGEVVSFARPSMAKDHNLGVSGNRNLQSSMQEARSHIKGSAECVPSERSEAKLWPKPLLLAFDWSWPASCSSDVPPASKFPLSIVTSVLQNQNPP